MDGCGVIRHLLVSDEGVLELVPVGDDPSRITADPFGVGVTLPAVRIWKISSIDRNILAPRGRRRVTQRIQVEAHAATVHEAKALLAAARHACADKIIAELAPLTKVVVLTAGEGPQGIDPTTTARVEQQDFSVSYNEEL